MVAGDMCGRFALTTRPEEIEAIFALLELDPFPSRYNIAPTQVIAVVGLKPDGIIGPRTVAALAGVSSAVSFTTLATVSGDSGYLNLRATYPSGQGAFGYEGVTRVVPTGGTVTVNGRTKLPVSPSVTVGSSTRITAVRGSTFVPSRVTTSPLTSTWPVRMRR